MTSSSGTAKVEEEEDLYAVLGVSSDVSQDVLKRAYRKQALATHSDHNQSKEADAAFCRLQRAWQVLRDPEQRAAYDQRNLVPVWIEIRADELLLDPEGDWRYDCLCGGAFFLDDVPDNGIIVPCDSCSKQIRILNRN